MQNNIERQILGAILLVLRPLARALLKVGVGYREFSEIAKCAFVQTATENYGLRGRPTNISRVAVMTGLTRKEVRRIRDKMDASEQTVVMKTTPISEILHRWYTDEQFVDDNGRPKELAFDGEGTTFCTLVRRYGGDVPPGAMRTELKRIGALKFSQSGKLSPTKRIAYNVELRDRLIGGLASIVYPAALNLAHNLDVENESEWLANFAVTSKTIRQSDKGRIRRISTDRINAFVESIDDLYGAYDTLQDQRNDRGGIGTVGVGIFYFEDCSSKSEFAT